MLKRLGALYKASRTETPNGRMIRGVMANIFDKSAILLVQLLAIPVLSSRWGADGYGIWLMLLTIPTYIQLSDFGVGTAAGVDITAKVAKGEYAEALDVLHSAWLFISTIVAVLAIAALTYAAYLYFTAPLGMIEPFSGRNLATAIGLIVIYSVVSTQMSVLTVVYRATFKFATAMVISGVLLLIEGLSVVAVVLSGGGLVACALSYVIIRLVGYVGFVIYLKKLEPWVRLGIGSASFATLKRLASPSLAALSLILSNAVALQGAVIVLGWVSGPATVAAFGAARMLSRIPLQFAGLVVRPSIPELTRALVMGDRHGARRLLIVNLTTSALATVPLGIALSYIGPQLLAVVSHGQLEVPRLLFVFLAGAMVANALWSAAASPLIAINKQSDFAYWYLASSLGVVMASAVDGSGTGNIVAIVMASSELVACISVYFALENVFNHIKARD